MSQFQPPLDLETRKRLIQALKQSMDGPVGAEDAATKVYIEIPPDREACLGAQLSKEAVASGHGIPLGTAREQTREQSRTAEGLLPSPHGSRPLTEFQKLTQRLVAQPPSTPVPKLTFCEPAVGQSEGQDLDILFPGPKQVGNFLNRSIYGQPKPIQVVDSPDESNGNVLERLSYGTDGQNTESIDESLGALCRDEYVRAEGALGRLSVETVDEPDVNATPTSKSEESFLGSAVGPAGMETSKPDDNPCEGSESHLHQTVWIEEGVHFALPKTNESRLLDDREALLHWKPDHEDEDEVEYLIDTPTLPDNPLLNDLTGDTLGDSDPETHVQGSKKTVTNKWIGDTLSLGTGSLKKAMTAIVSVFQQGPQEVLPLHSVELQGNEDIETTMADLSGYKDLSRAPMMGSDIQDPVGDVTSSGMTTGTMTTSMPKSPMGMESRFSMAAQDMILETKPEVETEFSGNVQTLIRLVSELPEGVTKQTGAQIIRLTMEAMGISMEDVLSEAQSAQSEMLEAVRANIKKIEEFKTVIRKLESDIKFYQGKANELSEIIDLFILSNASTGKMPSVDELTR